MSCNGCIVVMKCLVSMTLILILVFERLDMLALLSLLAVFLNPSSAKKVVRMSTTSCKTPRLRETYRLTSH